MRVKGSIAALAKLWFPMAALVWAANPAGAQLILDESRFPMPWLEIVADVDGDGFPDRLRTSPFSHDYDIITVELGGNARGEAFRSPPEIFIKLSANRSDGPGIEVTSDTSFKIHGGCFACGRSHYRYSYQIAFRDGAFMVAGYSSFSGDRRYLSFETCDVNFLTGRGEVAFDFDYALEEFETDEKPFLMSALDGSFWPESCARLEKYSEPAFLEAYVAWKEAQ